MRATERERAFSLFCEGKTLAEAAAAVGVHRSTTERWSREYHWRIHRERIWNEAREKMIHAQANRLALDEAETINAVYGMLREASDQFTAYRGGLIPKRALKYSLRDFLSIAKAYVDIEEAVVRRQLLRDNRPPIASGSVPLEGATGRTSDEPRRKSL